MINVRLPVLLVAGCLMLSACSLIPDYRRPPLPVAHDFAFNVPSKVEGANPTVDAKDLDWQDFFTDPRLKALISIALNENRDLRFAIFDILKARANVALQGSSLLPSINLTGSAEYQGWSEEETSQFSEDGSGGLTPFAGSRGVPRLYMAGIGFSSYEIDFFGRIRGLTTEAMEQLLRQEEIRKNVQITLISEIASMYVQWLADQELFRIAKQTQQSQSETVRLAMNSYNYGTASLLMLRQAQAQLSQASADVAQFQRQLEQDENQLINLIGAPLPSNLPSAMSFGRQTIMADLPVGLPSQVLLQRPDIRAAEHDLISANADIGVARANFFPNFTLTASTGIANQQFNHLFTSASTIWGVNPQLVIPIFNWGRNSAILDMSKLTKLQKVAAYEKTIQDAFREVSDALVARSTYVQQTSELQRLEQEAGEAYRLADLRYKAGIDPYQTTLDSLRIYYAAEKSKIMAQQLRYQNLITLYRALGGGWKET